MGNTGIYIHIPFCKSKCIYCDFYSITADSSQMDAYLHALLKEIDNKADSSLPVDTVFFGGGTPTYFGMKRLIAIMDKLRESFSILPESEITFEANPESLTMEDLKEALGAGFNRVSIGVQSFLDTDLRMLSRVHDSARAVSAVCNAADAGFKNISCDLIFALPGQSLSDWKNNLKKAVSLPLSHISCYSLIPEEGTPLLSSSLMDSIPDDDAQADMYMETVSFLNEHGFTQYEISNFSKAGMYSRHNMKYWCLDPYIGFGPGAHSDFGGIRSSSFCDVRKYTEYIESGFSTTDWSETITPAERQREKVMLGLRTFLGISENYFKDRAAYLELCEKYVRAGLGKLENGRFILTPQGFFVSNSVINDFLDIT